ncbi:MAG: thiamine pyrophosphate-binding protein [Bacillota bacterium]
MASVAATIAQVLKAAGVRYMFGYPGGEVVEFLDEARKEGIQFILTRHENAAAFAAGVTGQLTGIPGVCVSTLGPGAANMATGIANAWMDRDPLIAITGQITITRAAIATHQVMDLNAFYRPIVKWSVTVEPASAGDIALKAVRTALCERPGPVHLCLPSNLAKAEAKAPSHCSRVRPRDLMSGAPAEAVSRAAHLIGRSNRPVVLAGIGALRANAGKELARFAEQIQAPVVVAPKAKGIIGEDHPLFAGVLEMLGDELVLRLIESADCIVCCGLDVVELDKPWTFGAPVVHVDALPNVDEFYHAEEELVGHIGLTLGALREAVGPAAKWPIESIAEHSKQLCGLVRRKAQGMAPWEVVDVVRRMAPKDTIASCDVGAHKFLMGQLWTTYLPNSFLVSNGLSSMGYGLPAAMAAQLVYPDRHVVAVIGDGGFGMYVGELETAARLGLGLLVVVMCDGCLSLIAMSQERRGLPHYGVSLKGVDLSKVAEGLGAKGMVAETPQQVESAVAQWLEHRQLTLVQAIVDPSAYRLR